MSERDTPNDGEPDSAAPAFSPYDEPTGQIPVQGRTPSQDPADRDSFFDRHARRPASYSRVDELDDIDPDDVETRRIDPPTPAPADPAPADPAPADPESSDPALSGSGHARPDRPGADAPVSGSSRREPGSPAVPAPEPAHEPGVEPTVAFAKSPSEPAGVPADDALTTPEPELPPVGTARYPFLDDEDDNLTGTDTAVLDDDEPGSRRGLFGRRRRDAAVDEHETPMGVADEELEDAVAKARRGTLDLGLLVLRVGLGVVVGAHGLQKLFGLWNGPRLSGFEQMLVDGGFNADYAQALAIVGALSETVGGLMVILGLLTPIGASAILGTMLVAAAYRVSAAGGFEFFASAQGVEYELFLAVAAAAVILTGPGLYSLDYPRGWARRPFIGSFVWLIVGVAAAAAVWILANGTNPLG
ncbi:DoxX family protein [Gordonia paraffinivorans]|uniref:DoxX family protein n=1 Tax=Gordonia paraffinivorans TaxID=175628 RepID=UPI001447E931|nr:DoxX family membrane protein [Gordonia paraffinivorans]